MKLSLKLSRSRSNSPPSSTPSSPYGTPSTSPPTSSHKKLRSLIPNIGSSKRTRPAEIVESSTTLSSPTPTSPFSRRGKGKSADHDSAAASPASAAMASSSSSSAAAQGGMSEIEQVFAQFDANGDGKISTEELQAVLVSLGDETTREEAALMVREVDADGDGFIDLQEFVDMNKRCLVEAAAEEEMVAAFAIFDKEKKGWITAEGLQQVLQSLGGSVAQRTSVEDCRRMIRGVDRKGVGHVDFDDFKRMMTPLIF